MYNRCTCMQLCMITMITNIHLKYIFEINLKYIHSHSLSLQSTVTINYHFIHCHLFLHADAHVDAHVEYICSTDVHIVT